jgi:probable phosphoglycerate mutase
MTDEEILSAFHCICAIATDDGIEYSVKGIEDITAESKYDGKSVKVQAKLSNLKKTFSIDIAKGDVVTPYPQNFLYRSAIDDKNFSILAYTKESIIAEKFETLIARGTANSRSKDLFDMWLLMNEGIDRDKLNAALINTFVARETLFDKGVIHSALKEILGSRYKRELFEQYVRSHSFAKGITFDEVMQTAFKIEQTIEWGCVELPKVDIKCTLVRHGEDEQDKVGGWSDNKLTENGIDQVLALCQNLDEDYDVIISSDLQRAKETAELIAKSIHRSVVYDDSFREINNGIFRNMPVKEFLASPARTLFADMQYEEKYPEGESPKEFYERVKAGFINLLQKYNGKKVILVTHGGVITVIECLLNGWKYSNMLKIVPSYASKIEVEINN